MPNSNIKRLFISALDIFRNSQVQSSGDEIFNESNFLENSHLVLSSQNASANFVPHSFLKLPRPQAS